MNKKTIIMIIAIIAVVVLIGIVLVGVIGNATNKIEHPIATIKIEGYDTPIVAELYPEYALNTVKNFIALANGEFYDGLIIHRVEKDFVIQGGDPEGTGHGGSEETIVGEFSSNGINNNLSHTRGTISMARNGMDMNSASSQFFIVQKDATTLDGDYAAFGYVTEGMDIVDKIVEEIEPNDEMGTVEKEKQPIITSIRKVTKKKANN